MMLNIPFPPTGLLVQAIYNDLLLKAYCISLSNCTNVPCLCVGSKEGDWSLRFLLPPQDSVVIPETRKQWLLCHRASWLRPQINSYLHKLPAGKCKCPPWLTHSTVPGPFCFSVEYTSHFSLIMIITVFISWGNSRPTMMSAPGVIWQLFIDVVTYWFF